MAALCELVKNYGSSVVFCTATQPAIDFLLYPEIKPIELVDGYEGIYGSMKRVNFTNLGELSNKDLAEKMQLHDRAMCIVNTRRHALDLYNMLEHSDNTFHLSANMYPAHRRRVIMKIKQALANEQECRVVSTQLIEAGVDIDFPVVYRSMAGLDSIAQAAGRCNREGKLTKGDFSTFEPKDRYKLPSSISRTIDATTTALRSLKENEYPLSNRAMDVYYSKLYGTDGMSGYCLLDLEGVDAILPDYERGWREMRFNFRSISDRFRFISDIEGSMIISCDESEDLIERLRWAEQRSGLLRKLQQYTVPISDKVLKELSRIGAIDQLDAENDINILMDRTKYSEDYGVEMNCRRYGHFDLLDAVHIFRYNLADQTLEITRAGFSE